MTTAAITKIETAESSAKIMVTADMLRFSLRCQCVGQAVRGDT